MKRVLANWQWLSFLVPLIASATCLLICYPSIGHTAGLFLAGLVVATLLIPPLILAHEFWAHRAIALGSALLPIVCIWALLIFDQTIQIMEWMNCVVVLVCYTLAIAAGAIGLERLRISNSACSAIVVLLSLAWLSWPIWLAPELKFAQNAELWVARLVVGNPIFAIQGSLGRRFPQPWAERPIAYERTNIGDDIPYEMPASILTCAIVHLSIAIVLALPFILARLFVRLRRRGPTLVQTEM